ncbi:hypothetical protein CDAR_383121 [Caerostris darwini]|uniref:Uncharacterized protein n=1 Tax=Caerostris darwini TaxID=1538125 RepID=A0AAV4P0Q0_9ARAC|nr:hypothetical protein CDAR_383121 [Caerostris darwini]
MQKDMTNAPHLKKHLNPPTCAASLSLRKCGEKRVCHVRLATAFSANGWCEATSRWEKEELLGNRPRIWYHLFSFSYFFLVKGHSVV